MFNLFEFVQEITLINDNINIGFPQNNNSSLCYKNPNFQGFKCEECDCKDFD